MSPPTIWPWKRGLTPQPSTEARPGAGGGDGTPPLEGREAGPWKRIREGKSVVAIFGKCHLPPSPKWGPGLWGGV